MVLLSWMVVLLLLAVWSLLVWLGHAVLAAMFGGAGRLPWQELALPESWTVWLPQGVSEGLTDLIDGLRPWLEGLAAQMPSLVGATTVLAWVVWALGALCLVAAGGAAHAGLRWWRRSQQQQQPALSR
jgi:hypothetical protein